MTNTQPGYFMVFSCNENQEYSEKGIGVHDTMDWRFFSK